MVKKEDCGVVPGVTDCSADGLVHCLHTQVLIVDLSWKLSIRSLRLGEMKEGRDRGRREKGRERGREREGSVLVFC